LRAVFGETYPNPVRVVSVGVPVEDLLANPDSDKGTKTSVEFCGGTHLRNVGHIGRLVISSEEAIAKGIRRIVALTGPEAEKAFQFANRTEKRVNELLERVKQNPDVVKDQRKLKELTKEINDLNTEFNAILLPYWRKDKMRNTIKEAQKTLYTFDRKFKSEIANRVLQQAKELSQSTKDKIFVHVFEKGAHTNALDAALKQFKDQKAVMGISVNDDSQNFTVLAKVDKELADSGFKALDWVNKVCEVAGGRGGGKDQQAQANCESVSKIDDALEAARQFACLSIK